MPAHGASWGALTIFLALVISAGGLGWTENGNDYSRYLPAERGQEADRARGRARRRRSRRRCWRSSAPRLRTGVPTAHDRRPASSRVSRLVRLAVPDLRDPAAVRDQHPRPVLLGRDAAEPDPAAAPAALRGDRHRGVRRGRRLRGLLRRTSSRCCRTSCCSSSCGSVRGARSTWSTAGCAATATTTTRCWTRQRRPVLPARRRALAGDHRPGRRHGLRGVCG